jgi:hypothetical protein
MAVTLVVMVIAYAVSYRRRFAGILEGDRRPAGQRTAAAGVAFLDLFCTRAPGFARACERFVVRALLRNEAHRLVIAVSIGLGWLLAMEDVSEGAGREAPLVAAYLLLLGLRIAFDLPAGTSSNWVFRAALDPRSNESVSVGRRVMLNFLTCFVLVPALIYSWWRWGASAALLQTAFLLALSLCLIEALLAGYRKVPLACPLPGLRDDFLLICFLHLLGFEAFTHLGAGVEQVVVAQPALFPLIPVCMLAGWWWRQQRWKEALEAGEVEPGLVFDNLPARAVQTLNLSE